MHVQYNLCIPKCSGTGRKIRIRQSSDYRDVDFDRLKGDVVNGEF